MICFVLFCALQQERLSVLRSLSVWAQQVRAAYGSAHCSGQSEAKYGENDLDNQPLTNNYDT